MAWSPTSTANLRGWFRIFNLCRGDWHRVQAGRQADFRLLGLWHRDFSAGLPNTQRTAHLSYCRPGCDGLWTADVDWRLHRSRGADRRFWWMAMVAFSSTFKSLKRCAVFSFRSSFLCSTMMDMLRSAPLRRLTSARHRSVRMRLRVSPSPISRRSPHRMTYRRLSSKTNRTSAKMCVAYWPCPAQSWSMFA